MIQVIAQQESPVLVLTDDDQSARRLSEDFNQMYGQESSAVYPYRDFILRPIETVSREYEYLRLNVLSRLAKGELKAVFAGINAAIQYLSLIHIFTADRTISKKCFSLPY